VARVELSAAALEDLDGLTASHELPADTVPRVVRNLRLLDRLPLAGRALTGRWQGFRLLVGPWRWMLLVYVYVEAEDRVVVVTIQDARTSDSATTLEA
jgi:hypothetical protein